MSQEYQTDPAVIRSAHRVLQQRELEARLAFDIEHQIATRNGPLIYILASAHNEAIDALAELVDVDATDVDKVRLLQNKVKWYADTRLRIKKAVFEGRMASQELSADVFDEWAKELSPSDEVESG